MKKEKFIQIITTVERREDAVKIAEVLLRKKIAACIQIIEGIESYYWWEGKIEKSGEVLLFIKTRSDLFEKAKKIIKENHPYQVPEITGNNMYSNFERK